MSLWANGSIWYILQKKCHHMEMTRQIQYTKGEAFLKDSIVIRKDLLMLLVTYLCFWTNIFDTKKRKPWKRKKHIYENLTLPSVGLFDTQTEAPELLYFKIAIGLWFLACVLCSGAAVWLRVSIKWSTLDFVRESSACFPNQVLSLAPIGREILPPTNEKPRWSCFSQSGEVAVTRAAAITAPQPGGETQQRREET